MKSSDERLLSIGEVAEGFGLATHVLRHWESMGLLAPTRIGGSRRRYSEDDLYRVAAILRSKEAGLGLEDIRDMLTTDTLTARRALLRRKRDELTRHIAEAQAALELIDGALSCTHGDVATCPMFQATLAERVAAAIRCCDSRSAIGVVRRGRRVPGSAGRPAGPQERWSTGESRLLR